MFIPCFTVLPYRTSWKNSHKHHFPWLGWFLLRVSLLRSTFLSLLLVRLLLKHLSRYITTLVIIIILVVPTGPASNSRLVLSLPVWVWQHPSCSSHISNNNRVNWGAHTHHPAVSFVVRGIQILSKNLPSAHPIGYGPPSAVRQNCLVSPPRQELTPYPQSSLYNLCLVVPSPCNFPTPMRSTNCACSAVFK